MLLRSRPRKRGSCTGPLPSLLFSPRIHNYRNRIPGECPEKSFSYCVNSWRMPSEGPFAAFCAPPRSIEKIHENLLRGTGQGEAGFRIIWPDGGVHWIVG